MGQHAPNEPIEMGSPPSLARFVTQHDSGVFTGPLLAHYKESHQLDEAGLAALLGCTEADLVRLALCGRPRPEVFSSDTERIAAHVHAKAEPLASLYREELNLLRQPEKIYAGWWEENDWHVTVNGQPLKSISYHSFDGFAWGYDGSACLELALCLLRSHFGEWYVTRSYLLEKGKAWSRTPQCWELHEAFLHDAVAKWGPRNTWQLSSAEISAWVESQGMKS